MNEEDARQKIRVALDRLRQNRSPSDETAVNQHGSTVDYHIDAIIESGGGSWNETIARDYVQNLESQVEEEIEESNPVPASDTIHDPIIPEETDDPVRELGIPSQELKDELHKLDPSAEETYDREDMREYIQGIDERAEEDGRYR